MYVARKRSNIQYLSSFRNVTHREVGNAGSVRNLNRPARRDESASQNMELLFRELPALFKYVRLVGLEIGQLFFGQIHIIVTGDHGFDVIDK